MQNPNCCLADLDETTDARLTALENTISCTLFTLAQKLSFESYLSVDIFIIP